MKRFGIAAIVTLCLVSVCSATVSIQWIWDLNQAAGVFQNGGATLLPANSTIQLIYSSTGANTGYDPYNPLAPNAGNTVLASLGSSGNGFWNFGTGTYGAPSEYVGGYVFQRVFDTAFGSAPTNQSFYGDGPMSGPLGDQSVPTPPAPDVSYFFASVGGVGFTLTDRLTVIPEPTTWALFGIGALALFIRRRRS